MKTGVWAQLVWPRSQELLDTLAGQSSCHVQFSRKYVFASNYHEFRHGKSSVIYRFHLPGSVTAPINYQGVIELASRRDTRSVIVPVSQEGRVYRPAESFPSKQNARERFAVLHKRPLHFLRLFAKGLITATSYSADELQRDGNEGIYLLTIRRRITQVGYPPFDDIEQLAARLSLTGFAGTEILVAEAARQLSSADFVR
jgi:hypothetical protein